MSTIIFTSSARPFFINDPEQTQFEIEDIAHALSNICRFVGHTRQFYSVAQHAVLVSKLVPAEQALEALMHDASEAYLGDVATPLKRLLPDYQAIEVRVESAIYKQFDLVYPLTPEIKKADQIAFLTEARDVTRAGLESYPEIPGLAPHHEVIEPMLPAQAKQYFLDRFHELDNQRQKARRITHFKAA